MSRKKNSAKTAALSSIDSIYYHCCKRCTRKRQRATTTYLPQEVVFRFLLLVPAQLLHDVARHVCREWSLIIRSPNLAHHHYRNSIDGDCGGLLIQSRRFPQKVFYLEMRGGRLEISKFDCGFIGLAGCSCNGLVLTSCRMESDRRRRCTYVANPLTKQRMALPPLSPVGDPYCEDSAIAFLEASMVYKAARACGDKYIVPKTRIQLLTIGVDRAWREDIDVRHLLLSSEESCFYNFPLVTGGGGCYVHWASQHLVLTLNLETETVVWFSPPPLPPKFCGSYLEMGGNLSFIHYVSDKDRSGVWEMNSVTGEWTMLFGIDRGPINDGFKGTDVRPICWLVAREVLVFVPFYHQTSGIAYNVKTGEIQSFEWESPPRVSYHFQPHVNSLIWFGGGGGGG